MMSNRAKNRRLPARSVVLLGERLGSVGCHRFENRIAAAGIKIRRQVLAPRETSPRDLGTELGMESAPEEPRGLSRRIHPTDADQKTLQVRPDHRMLGLIPFFEV